MAVHEVADFDKRKQNNMEQKFERKLQKKRKSAGDVGGSKRICHSSHEKRAERKLQRRAGNQLRRSFQKDAAAWDQTTKKGECLNGKLWNWF